MKKVISGFLLFIIMFTLASCNKNNRIITFNVDDDTVFDVTIGALSFDLSPITAFDQDGNDLSELIQIDGSYDLNTVGMYSVVVFVFDDYQTKGELKIIINVIELTCEEDSLQDKCIIPVSSIEFTEESNLLTEVFIDEFIKLKWTILPSDATNQDITITSSDETIATVSTYGYVFGISEGNVTITVSTLNGDYSITKEITVLAKSCNEDPFQEKCVSGYLGDDSRVITLPDENVSGTNYQLIYKNNKIYYEIYVRTFADSDNNNIGDFQGIIDNLPYLKSLGVGGLWLMPIMQSRSDHGYETDDYFAVDNEYGTMIEFKELVSTAKAMGIDIIIDLVVNHMGAYNSIFQDVLKNGVTSPYYSWFTWIDSSDPRFTLKGAWGQTIWYNPFGNPYLKKTSFTVHSSLSGLYYAAYFSDWMPDLNYQNQEVIDYVYQVGSWWIEETGVAGYRMDAIAHIFGVNEYLNVLDTTQANIDFLSSFKEHCAQSNQNVYIVG
ncbi:MAG: Ig-like domain-containing protein, partial [Firmicutes bacterium]|nr:Ig-like domain-containing protein [Bacillota bacterium]